MVSMKKHEPSQNVNSTLYNFMKDHSSLGKKLTILRSRGQWTFSNHTFWSCIWSLDIFFILPCEECYETQSNTEFSPRKIIPLLLMQLISERERERERECTYSIDFKHHKDWVNKWTYYSNEKAWSWIRLMCNFHTVSICVNSFSLII